MSKKRTVSKILVLGLFWGAAPLLYAAEPGKFALSLEGMGAVASSSIPLSATVGVGPCGSIDYRFSPFFAAGISGGMVEFIAPKDVQDMKSIWLDLNGQFFPMPSSPSGEAYVQLDFGFSPHLGLFPDYFPNYTSQNYGQQFYKEPPGVIFWNAQASIGYLFALGKDQALDVGLQYGLYGPPSDTPLQTIGLRAGIVWDL